MPSLSQAINTDRSGYVPVTASPQASLPPAADLQPTSNPMIRCPLPPIFEAQPDSLRQFYVGGQVPQTRLLSAVTTAIGGGGSGGNAVVTTTVITPSGGVVPPPPPIVAQSTAITTTVLAPNQQFVGTLNAVSLSFQLLNITSNVPARITIYGTAFAQTGDLSRGVDQPPPAGTTQGIITDIVLDTAPLSWQFQDRIGSNGEVPQKPEAFVTITNLSGAAVPVTITLQFVPLES